MPRYLFYVFNGSLSLDADGFELSNLAIARQEAMILTGYLLRKHAPDVLRSKDWSLYATDPNGSVLFKIEMRLTDGAPVPISALIRPCGAAGSPPVQQKAPRP